MRYKDQAPLAGGWGGSKGELKITQGLCAPSCSWPRSQSSCVGASYTPQPMRIHMPMNTRECITDTHGRAGATRQHVCTHVLRNSTD